MIGLVIKIFSAFSILKGTLKMTGGGATYSASQPFDIAYA